MLTSANLSLHAKEGPECERAGIDCEGHHMGVRQGAPAESVKSIKLFCLTTVFQSYFQVVGPPKTNLPRWCLEQLVIVDQHDRHWLSNLAHTQDSIYGQRDAAISGIAVLHQDRGNIYRRGTLWKQGVIDDVQMLPRSEMFKPEVGWCKNCGVKHVLIVWLTYVNLKLS